MKTNFYLFLELKGTLINSALYYKQCMMLNPRSVRALNKLTQQLNTRYNVNLRIIDCQNKVINSKNLLVNSGVDFSYIHSFAPIPKYFFHKKEIVSYLNKQSQNGNFAVIDNGIDAYPTRFDKKNIVSTNINSGVLEEHDVNAFLDKLNINENVLNTPISPQDGLEF